MPSIPGWYNGKMEELRRNWGNSCMYPGCSSTNRLEFAHVIDFNPSGREEKRLKGGFGRGRANRYHDIKNHPEDYVLLCHDHHVFLDNGGYQKEDIAWIIMSLQ